MKQSINRKGDKYHQIEYSTKNNDIIKSAYENREENKHCQGELEKSFKDAIFQLR